MKAMCDSLEFKQLVEHWKEAEENHIRAKEAYEREFARALTNSTAKTDRQREAKATLYASDLKTKMLQAQVTSKAYELEIAADKLTA